MTFRINTGVDANSLHDNNRLYLIIKNTLLTSMRACGQAIAQQFNVVCKYEYWIIRVVLEKPLYSGMASSHIEEIDR